MAEFNLMIHFCPYLLQHVMIDFRDGINDSSSQLRQILW
jgi:hypothetical protein